MRPMLTALITVVLAGAAFAADEVLQLNSGKLAIGEVISIDEKGVTLARDGVETRFDWSALTPLSQYEVRSDRLAEDDAVGHATLAVFCLENGLYARARNEIYAARGVGHPDPRAMSELSAAIDQAEADAFFARVEQLVAEEDYDQARAEVRSFLLQAPKSEHTERARAMVPDLIRRSEAHLLREEEAKRAIEEDKRVEALAARIDKLLESAERDRSAAASAYAEALQYHEAGNVTRARKAYEKAEGALLDAHRTLRRVQSLAHAGVAHEKADRDKADIRKKLLDVYLGLARLYLDDRNYRRGIVFVNKILYLDPVNKEALAMRKDVDENRLDRKSLRGLINAPPIGTR